jgi:DNA (cytosine-5)-methyltransferase 1
MEHISNNAELKEDHDFSFIDLFAGIGGIRTGFEKNNGKCVFTSEWNKYSVQTYQANFNNDHPIYGDITTMHDPQAELPDHDVLLAGFPCQPFSIAGVSKKNSLGRAHGFACDTQGTLFFDVARIIDAKRPVSFLLENVKNLQSHDKGNTFRVIRHVLSEELGYDLHVKVIDGKGFVPQHRERIYMVGFREKRPFSWDEFNHPHAGAQTMKNILHSEDGSESPEHEYTYGVNSKVNEKYTLSDKLWSYLQNYAEKHRLKGNGFGFGKVGPEDTARTLSARYYKDGSEILIDQGARKRPRRLTPRECARLMGYDDTFVIPVSDTQSYKQFGNSVIVPVIEEIARIMKPHVMAIRQPFLQNGEGSESESK